MAALVVPGLIVAGTFRADDAPEVFTSDGGAASQPGDLLFERSLVDGSTLRDHHHRGPERDRRGVARVT